MNEEQAKFAIENLLGRIVRDGNGYILPGGRLSAKEVEAFQALGFNYSADGVIGVHVDDSERVFRARQPESFKRQHDIPLRLSALTRPASPEETVRLCLDFGTAMSKGWAALGAVEEALPLRLGAIRKERDPLPVASAIYVSQQGRVYFGEAAQRQHRQELSPDRKLFDNLKRMLSEAEVGQDLDDVAVSEQIDPTKSGLTKGDFLVLYLAWLTDTAVTALAEIGGISEEDARGVKRRFAIPCFANALDDPDAGGKRADWANKIMRRALLRAQIVADTLNDRWDDLNTRQAAAVLREAREIDTTQLEKFLTKAQSIREPIAAGASVYENRLSDAERRARGLLFIVDAGAGTTDFAVFQSLPGKESEDQVRYGLISPSVRMTRIAGNQVDEVLRPLVLRACGINPATGQPRSEEDFAFIKVDLESQIRTIKQSLFTHGEVRVNLQPHAVGILRLKDVEEDPAYQDLAGQLLDARREVFRGLFDNDYLDTVRRSGSGPRIRVLVTGGSSSVPIFSNLAERSMEIDGTPFRLEAIRELPDWVQNLPRDISESLSAAYPQCAVAIGGAAPDLPKEYPDLRAAITPPPPGPRILERYQVKGT